MEPFLCLTCQAKALPQVWSATAHRSCPFVTDQSWCLTAQRTKPTRLVLSCLQPVLMFNTSNRTWFEKQPSKVLPPPADIFLVAQMSPEWEGFALPAPCSLSFLRWVLAALVQIPLVEEAAWELLSCGPCNVKFCVFVASTLTG